MEVRPKEEPSHLCSSPPAFGETWASKRGVEPSNLGGCKPAVRSMKRSLPRRDLPPKGSTGSRAPGAEAKAMEGMKSLEQQSRRTQRRRGRGTLAQPSWEQERAVSAPAVRPVGCHRAGGLGAPNPISREERRSGRERSGSRSGPKYRRSGVTPVDGKGRASRRSHIHPVGEIPSPSRPSQPTGIKSCVARGNDRGEA